MEIMGNRIIGRKIRIIGTALHRVYNSKVVNDTAIDELGKHYKHAIKNYVQRPNLYILFCV